MSFQRRGKGSRFGQRDTRCARDRNGVRNPIVRARRNRARAVAHTVRDSPRDGLHARSSFAVQAVQGCRSRARHRHHRRARRAGRPARTQRCRQDDDAADAARRDHAGPRRRSRSADTPPASSQPGDGASSASPPATSRCPIGSRCSEALGVFAGWYGVRDHQAAVAPGARTVRDHPPRRPAVLGAVLRSAHARRHRQGDPARPGAARPRRADRLARPRHRAEGPLGAARRSARRPAPRCS